MNWKTRLAPRLVHLLSPQDLQEVAGPVSVQFASRMDREERVAFFRQFVEEYLGPLLADLNREERADLMNALLPKLAQEFPLADLDILGAFSSAEGSPWVDEEAELDEHM